jgi:hypothetical protein
VRGLLVAFLQLTESPQHAPTRQFYERLDSILQHSQQLMALCQAMGLA